MRRILVPLLALLVAGGAALYARKWVESRQVAPSANAAPGPAPGRMVLVAAVDLPAGSFLQPGSIRWQAWPDVELPPSYFVKGVRDEDQAVGAVVRYALARGQPLTDGGLVKPGERGFLAAVLAPGMRAVSVPVDEASANAGLIFPGDRVDLVLAQSLATEAGERGRARRVAETVLEDVRVLAMGRRLKGAEGEEGSIQARTVTLEVTPADAERVALVTELGKLTLSLRSLARPDEPAATAPARVTWDDSVSRALGAGSNGKVLVLRGGQKSSAATSGGEPAR
ncbi:MAG: Flp pilus assembly protein CpaB [Geminicoccaceae bacterium]|nr:Flp pilus assembly protein CpaB [Geminicoccaceae bacterium]